MLSIVKKALQLEGDENENISESSVHVERLAFYSEKRSRSLSPISRFRYIDGDEDEAHLMEQQDNYENCNRSFHQSFAIPGKDDVAEISVTDKRYEEEENHSLAFFFKPVEQGSLLQKMEREIEAARKAAAIFVTVDLSFIDERMSHFTEDEIQNMQKLKESIKDPTSNRRVKSKTRIKSTESCYVKSGNDSMNMKNFSYFMTRSPHFVEEKDESGEGVNVETIIGGYENQKKLAISPVPSAGLLELDNNSLEVTTENFSQSMIQDFNKHAALSSSLSAHSGYPMCEEKKEEVDDNIPDSYDSLPLETRSRPESAMSEKNKLVNDIMNCLSATESDVGSVDGLPSSLQSRWLMGKSPKQQLLASLDGIPVQPKVHHFMDSSQAPSRSLDYDFAIETQSGDILQERDNVEESQSVYEIWPFSMFCGKGNENTEENEEKQYRSYKEHTDVPLALLDCANIIYQEDRCHFAAPAVPTSLIRVASEPAPLSYAETLLAAEADPRMQDWVSSQFKVPGKPLKDGSYSLGKSRTVIVHEIQRGSWTWATAWSPDGTLLAVATENHHLAVIETTASTVWRVRHDERIKGPIKNHTTHSIRSIAWGQKFIAIGGTGNAVSIISPVEPFPILHTITGTGFVGTLHWRENSSILAFGSRLDKVTIVRICPPGEDSIIHGSKQIESKILATIDLKHWANTVKFCPGGNYLAVGDAGGIISVYSCSKLANSNYESTLVAWFPRNDSILSVEWSPDGKWLYAGGEDRTITIIDCTFWEIVHKKARERWVQCIASSNGGSHLAVGGVSSEISLLDTKNGWDSVMGIELKGLVPLSASWHPQDQYLALTGQNNSILVVETTNARHVKGHHLLSISPILAIEFSPDGRMAVVGNQSGVVTFFSLSGTTFITAYELVITLNKSICARWSSNGTFAVLGGKDAVVIVGHKKTKRQGKKIPPKLSGFSVRKVIRDFGETKAVSIDHRSQLVAVSGNYTRILDARADFATVREWNNGPFYANAFSSDGQWFAMIGEAKLLTIYDTSEERVGRWRPIFSMKCDFVGLSLAWGPLIVGGLLYLAYGGTSNEIFIMEIRTREATWETVLRIPRDGPVNCLDWSTDGLLAAAIGNGTVGVIDLSYLQSGVAVNEMDYNWQRQALTCFTEIRRNRGRNSMKAIRWLPAAPGSDRLLAVGGTDGEVEIIDLTERSRCRGYRN